MPINMIVRYFAKTDPDATIESNTRIEVCALRKGLSDLRISKKG